MATVYFNSPQLACLFFGADGNGCTHQAGDMTFCTCGKRSAMDALEVDFKNPAADDLWLKTACCCYHCGFSFGEGLCAIRRGSNCCWGCYQDAGIFSCFDKNTSRAACLKSAGNTKCYQCEFDETCLCTQDLTQLNLCWCLAVWKSTSVSGAPDNSSLSHFSAMTRPSWLRRAARNRHRHAIEQASRRWRGGRRDDSARTRRKLLISTQAASATSWCGRTREAPTTRDAHVADE